MSTLCEHTLANLSPELQMALGVLVESCGGGPASLPRWLEALQLNAPKVTGDRLGLIQFRRRFC